MSNILQETILGDWGGINVIANIDEQLEDIRVAVKYSDHGDDFLFVKMKDDKAYEYGWYISRKNVICPEYDEFVKSQCDYGFIRKPKLFCAYDKRSKLSNEIFLYVEQRFMDDWGFSPMGDDPGYAQRKFDRYIEFMEGVYNRRITYHCNNDKQKIERYLEKNGIMTQENLDRLNGVRFESGENGIDGTAGKIRSHVGECLQGDTIESIWYNGEFLDLRKVKIKSYYDRDYFERFKLHLDQFK